MDGWLPLPLSCDLCFMITPSPGFSFPGLVSPPLGGGPVVATFRAKGSQGRHILETPCFPGSSMVWGCFHELHKDSSGWFLL